MRVWRRRGTDLALEELETGTSAGGDVAQLVLGVVLRNNGGGITAADDDSGAVLRRLDGGIEQRF